MILAVAGGADLLQRTQQVFFQKKQSRVTKVYKVKVVSAIVHDDQCAYMYRSNYYYYVLCILVDSCHTYS